MCRSSACRLDSSKNYEWSGFFLLNSESGSVFHLKHRLDLFIFVPKSVAENTEDISASTTVQYLYFSFYRATHGLHIYPWGQTRIKAKDGQQQLLLKNSDMEGMILW